MYDRLELARRLRLPPRTVRRLIREYGDWLSAPSGPRFTALDLARLQIAARLELAGRPRAAIEEALATTRPQDRPDAWPVNAAPEESHEAVQAEREVAASAVEPLLQSELARLREVIEQGAERQHADRDRVLMALMRTQQEVSHLRSELLTYRSRSDRRKGVIRRLFG